MLVVVVVICDLSLLQSPGSVSSRDKTPPNEKDTATPNGLKGLTD